MDLERNHYEEPNKVDMRVAPLIERIASHSTDMPKDDNQEEIQG